MASNNPLLRSTQNNLVADLETQWQRALKKVWKDDGQLNASLSDSFIIQDNIKNFANPLTDHVKVTRQQLELSKANVAKRRDLLEKPTDFFFHLLACNDYSEINDAHRGLHTDFPTEHFAWATNILLNTFFRGKDSELDTLMDRLDDTQHHEEYAKALLAALDASEEEQKKLEDLIEKQQAFTDRLNGKEGDPISDFEFMNSAYGLSHLNSKDEDEDARSDYFLANEVLVAYLDYLEDQEEDETLLQSVYARVIRLTGYVNSDLKTLAFPPGQMMELPVDCRGNSYTYIAKAEVTSKLKKDHANSFRQAFEHSLFEMEKDLQERLRDLRKSNEQNALLSTLNSIEEKAILKSLKLIANYRYTKADQTRVAQTYQKFNQFFRDLLEGKINELEFEAKLNHLIEKYSVDRNLWIKVKTYVKAIIEYITGKDKNRLPCIFYVNDLRAYSNSFNTDFIGFLNKLSADAKEQFVNLYVDKLEERVADLSSEKQTSEVAEDGEKSSSEENKSASEANSSSQVSVKFGPLIDSFRKFTADNDQISDFVDKARELESQLMSASLEVG